MIWYMVGGRAAVCNWIDVQLAVTSGPKWWAGSGSQTVDSNWIIGDPVTAWDRAIDPVWSIQSQPSFPGSPFVAPRTPPNIPGSSFGLQP